jgi:hypothetical protein
MSGTMRAKVGPTDRWGEVGTCLIGGRRTVVWDSLIFLTVVFDGLAGSPGEFGGIFHWRPQARNFLNYDDGLRPSMIESTNVISAETTDSLMMRKVEFAARDSL